MHSSSSSDGAHTVLRRTILVDVMLYSGLAVVEDTVAAGLRVGYSTETPAVGWRKSWTRFYEAVGRCLVWVAGLESVEVMVQPGQDQCRLGCHKAESKSSDEGGRSLPLLFAGREMGCLTK